MSSLLEASSIVIFLGGVGGVASSLLAGMTDIFSHRSEGDAILRPGIVINAALGSLAALVIWGAYGADAGSNIVGASPNTVTLTLFQAVMSIPVGMSGGRILTTMAEKQADKVARNILSREIKKEQTRKIRSKD